MNGFIQQLRKRGVFRVAGLYIALVWLLLQIADVVFPAFEIPDEAVRYILVFGAAGFPVALLFAWFFEITDQGLLREDEIKEAGARRIQSRRYVYGATVLLLVVALGISIFFNVQTATRAPDIAPENISILIADFVNDTGDPIFNGSIEQSLAIGLEGAAFITSYRRQQALDVAAKISEGDTLSEERARLVALREGIKLVLSGGIRKDGEGFLLLVSAKDPREGTTVAAAEAEAETKLEVLQAVGELANSVREALGDITLAEEGLTMEETFSTASLEAVSYYSQAQSLQHLGRDEEAVKLYSKAVDEDPGFGRAWSGWALSEYNLGNSEQAGELWKKTLSTLNSMTERERYRSLGLYYSVGSRNFDKAIENYELLVSKYPADIVGRNNLAVTYFFNMQFEEALKQGRGVLEIYPDNPLFRSNYALYAMYAGDFETARQEATYLLKQETDFYKAYLPIAMARLAEGDTEGAARAYRTMVSIDSRAESLSKIGLGDIAIYEGNYDLAIAELRSGIATDANADNKRGQADKQIALAQALMSRGDQGAATEAASAALELSRQLAHVVPAAQLYIDAGNLEAATELQLELQGKLQREFRAAAGLIDGQLKLARGETIAAVDSLRASQEKLDSWLIHFALGQAYFKAGYHAEALSEFELCQSRIGEATALFLDDIPTFRYTAPLGDWLEKTRLALGMPE